MNYDCNLKRLIGEVNDLIKKFGYSNNKYNAILYVRIEGGFNRRFLPMPNEFAIMTVNSDCFCFYRLILFSKPPFSPENIYDIKFIPYDIITKLKARKFLFWRSIKIYTNDNSNKRCIKLIVSEKTIGVDFQKENLLKLLEFIEEKGLKKYFKDRSLSI
jgi:hypothetical protein